MLKHIITLDCPRRCPYCITKNVPRVEARPERYFEVYLKLAQQHSDLMITGGEPTWRPDLLAKSFNLGKQFFDRVFLTTMNPKFLSHWSAPFFDAITYSHHDRPISDVPAVPANVRAYLAVMYSQYSAVLVRQAELFGFSGITVNEDHRKAVVPWMDDLVIDKRPFSAGFTLKINRHRGVCLRHTFLLPDCSIEEDFLKFL